MYYAMVEMEYLIYYSCVAVLIAFIIGGVCLLFSIKEPEYDLGSAYECGFEPFEESHRPFSVAFYLIGLLFVLFDVELIIIMPWCIMAEYGCLWSSWAILVVFFEFLLLGFVFEWSRGAINVILR